MRNILHSLDYRQQKLGLGALFLLISVALLTYLVGPQIKSYRKAATSRAVLVEVARNGDEVASQLTVLRKEVDALQHRLHGDMASYPEN